MAEKDKRRLTQAMTFILLFGIVSLFSDMTHEGAMSLRGAYLSLLGASAGAIGFASGLGELAGYGLRYVFGLIADKTGKYWLFVIVGYIVDLAAVPLLALVGPHGWIAACALFVVQRTGKAFKKPSKDTIMSFAATQEGAGKSFAIQEALDQIGAFLGPVLLFLVMLGQADASSYQAYATCFAVLGIPAIVTFVLLMVTRSKFPHPEEFEPEPKEFVPFRMRSGFVAYIVGISLFAFGFLDYSLVLMHVSRTAMGGIIAEATLPLVYAMAMLVDAVAALVFGTLYDRYGAKVLVVATLVSAPFAPLVFLGNSTALVLLGVALWGVGMGAQESILKAAVSTMVPKASRATGFGVFECSFGVFWFFGSWFLGCLYDASIPVMVAVSVAAQLAAIPFYLKSAKEARPVRIGAE